VSEKSNVTVELHVNLNKKCKVRFDTAKMIKNAVPYECNGLNYYMLEPVDNVLYLMFHTIFHLCYVNPSSANAITINLQNIYDIAQILDNECIDWDVFHNRSVLYKLTPFVALLSHVINDIFPNLIPPEIINKQIDIAMKSKFQWKKTFSLVMKKAVPHIIVGDFDDIPVIRDTRIQASKYDKNRDWKKIRKAWMQIEKKLKK
jgi:hypothetical protein